jgi:hypothetical protein
VQNESAIYNHAPQIALCWKTAGAQKQVHCLRETRPGCKEWCGWQAGESRYALRVMGIVTVDQCDQGSGISECHNEFCWRSCSISLYRRPVSSESGSLVP